MSGIRLGRRTLYRANKYGTVAVTIPAIWCQTVEAVAGDMVDIDMLPGNILQIRLNKKLPTGGHEPTG
jgi:hypothetical protein